MKTLFITLFLTFFVASCGYMVDEDEVIRAAEKQGYSNIEITAGHQISPKWFGGCSDSDDAAFDAIATNSLGHRVDITICAGWPFKGVTIRTR